MKLTGTLIFLHGNYSTTEILCVIILSAVAGVFLKSGIVFKQRRRILRLEDEMLANHARILSLEKKVAEQKKDKNGAHEYAPGQRKAELKVS